MTDLLQRLEEARPTDADIDATWSTRAEVFDQVVSRGDRRRRRQRVTRGVAVAAAGAAIAVPVSVYSGAAAADEDLRDLAGAARTADWAAPGKDDFLHVRWEATQHNSEIFGDGNHWETDREYWVRWDGKQWAIDEKSSGWREFHVFPRPNAAHYGDTPEFAAALPDDPEALGAYLHANVHGSTSHQEAMFEAVASLAQSHFLPPKTLAAALEVLADVDGVRTKDVTYDGRDAVEISHSRWRGPLSSTTRYVLDRETAQLLAIREDWPGGGSYHLRVTTLQVVDAIPPETKRLIEVNKGERERIR